MANDLVAAYALEQGWSRSVARPTVLWTPMRRGQTSHASQTILSCFLYLCLLYHLLSNQFYPSNFPPIFTTMPAPSTPYQPHAALHKDPQGPGDKRPTALQIVKDCNAVGKLGNKTILITGCSSGIGVETARALYETGARLFLTARDMPKLEKVIDDIVANAENESSERPVPIEMHLDSLESVRKGAEDFKAKSGGKLNILISAWNGVGGTNWY
jgi:hypothetical protein